MPSCQPSWTLPRNTRLRVFQAVILPFVAAPPLVAALPAPNILVITADNLGYGDLPCYNPRSTIQAPHLDRLAAEGARLTSFYTASPTCTVSRACLLTGRVPQRHGLVRQLQGVRGNYGTGLNQAEILLPQILSRTEASFATACFGKWNIGFAPGSRPTERGFGEFIGHASGNLDYFHHNYRERHDLYNGTAELHRPGVYATDLFADAAIEFITRKSGTGRPWFCYLAFNAPHFPTAGNKRPGQPNRWQAPDWALKAYGWTVDEPDPRRRYAAVVTALDSAIGRVIDTVDRQGVADRTFVFFMSDNGAFRLGRVGLDVGSNEPLRQGGVTCWEGGIRVPAIARWPDRIKAGSVVSAPCWSLDLLPTCVAVADGDVPGDRVYDGRDLLPLLTGDAGWSVDRSFFFSFERHAALRLGDWKIVRDGPDRPWQLFDLGRDIAERHDRGADQPDLLAERVAEFARWEHSIQKRVPVR